MCVQPPLAPQEEVASLQRGLEAATAQLQQLQQHNAALEQVQPGTMAGACVSISRLRNTTQ